MISPVREWQTRFYGCAGVPWFKAEIAFAIDFHLSGATRRLKEEIKSL